MIIPPVARLIQTIDQPTLADPAGEVRRQIRASRLARRLQPGARVAVAVGSRGIAAIAVMVRAAVDELAAMGYQPFIVAAMGSHGGATPAGQRDLLASYGITPEAMGVPVRTEMDTVELGTNAFGLPIFFDKNAAEADGLVLINRVKPHTDFHARHESGILKMLVIGLGKRQGASQVHKLGVRGLKELLPQVGRVLVERTPFALGLAIVENAAERTALVQAIEPEDLFDAEPPLLDRARGLMGRLPFEEIDILVVGELGKNYSGAGMDPNVLGRLMVENEPDFDSPRITRIAVLDVSEESHGNIVGVGLADVTTQRLVDRVDQDHLRINVITSCMLHRAKLPLVFPTDRDAIEAGIETCWQVDPAKIRMVVIPNTLELTELWASRAFLAQVRADPRLRWASDFEDLPFSPDGTLLQEELFPQSVRGRRARAVEAAVS